MTGTPLNADRTEAVDVAEAAQRLGITPDAVRARIRRGSLPATKEGGAWRVQLPRDTRPGTGTNETGPDATPDSALIDQLRSEVAYLRGELSEARRQAATERERADVLQREALQRIEALTAGTITTGEGAEASRTAAADAKVSGIDADTQDATAGLLGRLWRALLGR